MISRFGKSRRPSRSRGYSYRRMNEGMDDAELRQKIIEIGETRETGDWNTPGGLSELFDLLVPIEGVAKTVGGEIVRLACFIGHRRYNDGDFNVRGIYGLCELMKKYKSQMQNKRYADGVLRDAQKIVDDDSASYDEVWGDVDTDEGPSGDILRFDGGMCDWECLTDWSSDNERLLLDIISKCYYCIVKNPDLCFIPNSTNYYNLPSFAQSVWAKKYVSETESVWDFNSGYDLDYDFDQTV